MCLNNDYKKNLTYLSRILFLYSYLLSPNIFITSMNGIIKQVKCNLNILEIYFQLIK